MMGAASLAALTLSGQTWQPLFDGKSLNGWVWEVPEKQPASTPSWVAEDGVLRCTPGVGKQVYLITRGAYRDFELRFEWKAEARANSGVKYRLQGFSSKNKPDLTYDPDPESPNRIEPVGLEYQITDDLANPDALSTPRHAAAAVYDYIEPSKEKAGPAKPDVWHTSRIVARGLHIEHWLDEKRVVNIDFDSPEAEASFAISTRKSAGLLRKQERRESPIALQIHDGVVWFRNLQIRRF